MVLRFGAVEQSRRSREATDLVDTGRGVGQEARAPGFRARSVQWAQAMTARWRCSGGGAGGDAGGGGAHQHVAPGSKGLNALALRPARKRTDLPLHAEVRCQVTSGWHGPLVPGTFRNDLIWADFHHVADVFHHARARSGARPRQAPRCLHHGRFREREPAQELRLPRRLAQRRDDPRRSLRAGSRRTRLGPQLAAPVGASSPRA